MYHHHNGKLTKQKKTKNFSKTKYRKGKRRIKGDDENKTKFNTSKKRVSVIQ
jgi:hypothetical protein